MPIPIVFQAAVEYQQARNVDSIKAIMGALEPGMASQLENLIEQYALEKRNEIVIPPTCSAQPGILTDDIELKANKEFRIIGTDKNLGLAIISNKDYENMAKQHLLDNLSTPTQRNPRQHQN
jgi:hypothetical protein